MQKRFYISISALALLFLPPVLGVACVFAEESASIEARLGRTASYLAADEMAGRGLGTPEIDRAAEFLRQEFERLGLKTDLFEGSPFQTFQVTVDAKLGDENSLRLAQPEGETPIELKIGADYQPLAIGGPGTIDLPLVFAGYGISAAEADYDDYADIDVDGKAVIVLRHEPQQNNPHSALNGTDDSMHAPFRRKVSNAIQHGAAAVIFVTDQVAVDEQVDQWLKRRDAAVVELAEAQAEFAKLESPTAEELAAYRDNTTRIARKIAEYADGAASEEQAVLAFTGAGDGGDARSIPVFHFRRGAIDQLLAAAGKPTLAELEKQIDETAKPQSFDITPWRATGNIDIKRREVTVKNVAAVLEGEGPLAEETIVIGAHYDHLGRGGEGSAQPGSNEIHNGADDNASGVSALLEVARQLTERDEPLPRQIVFIAFTGEERGLLGSAEYTRNPPVPLENTIAMFNFDMVGRLKDNKLIVNGTGTADTFAQLVDDANEKQGFDLAKSPGGFGPSDHSSFYAKQIPVLHFFTGSHAEYHRPDDDFGLLNLSGMRRVSDFVAEIAERIATAPERPKYVEVAGEQQPSQGPRDPRPYFGSVPDFAQTAGGYALSGVTPGSPAAEGGLQAGDQIIRLGEFKIDNLEDFDGALRKFSAGDRVDVVVRRDGKEVQLKVTLDPPR
ncbi:MAG: M20/M25/M40 family metallo-hydrolase [Pirellulales bacterium]